MSNLTSGPKGPESQGSPEQKEESFEKSVEKLQGLIRRLESGELTLEDSLKSFEEGVKLARTCQGYLERAEKKVEILTNPGASADPKLEPFKA